MQPKKEGEVKEPPFYQLLLMDHGEDCDCLHCHRQTKWWEVEDADV